MSPLDYVPPVSKTETVQPEQLPKDAPKLVDVPQDPAAVAAKAATGVRTYVLLELVELVDLVEQLVDEDEPLTDSLRKALVGSGRLYLEVVRGEARSPEPMMEDLVKQQNRPMTLIATPESYFRERNPRPVTTTGVEW